MLYTLGIWIYELGIRLASLWNPKAKAFIHGRKESFDNLPQHSVWMHCASLGEFEQGRPLLERIKKEKPEQKIILTFYSPSGYEHAQTAGVADVVRYLPLDYPIRIRRWVNALQPQCLLLVKYELWPHLLKATQKKNIPIHIVAGRFSARQKRLKWMRKILQEITHFWVQDEGSALHLQSLGIEHATVVGDSRFDRVYENAQANKELPLIQAFKGNDKLLVMGSTWPADTDLLPQETSYKRVLAPHDLKYTPQLQKQFKGLLYSEANKQNVTEAHTLIIDNIGLLASIYRYADVAYIGGAFGSGLHNILEAAVYGCPLLFGPKHHNFPEAAELINIGGAKSVNNDQAFQKAVSDYLTNKPQAAIQSYCQSKRGATEKMWQGIFN